MTIRLEKRSDKKVDCDALAEASHEEYLENKRAKRKSKKKPVKKSYKPSIIPFIKNTLRKASYRWSPINEAMANARVERGKYKCAQCGGIFGPKEINRDHIEPVEDPHVGFVDWNTYISRLFCSADGIQILCKADHDAKTFRENQIRRMVKKEKNKEEEDI